VRFEFAREKDGRVHFRKRHPEVTVREVKELFEFRMVVQPSYRGASKGIGHTHSRRFLVVIFKWGKNKDYVFILTAYPAKRAHVEVYLRTTGGVP
jgi:D-alanine-D-alanine ligase-like ATP-grasp enzyme